LSAKTQVTTQVAYNDNSAVSLSVPVQYLNYTDYNEEADNGEWEQCRSCRGTGLDDEWDFDCPDCGGEGSIPAVVSVLSSRVRR
jgi:DnaJ-class molecular chaperone